MQLIERILNDPEEEIKIAARDNDFLVQGVTATIFTRLIDGRFPKWRDVLPERGGASVQVELTVGPFFSAVRQAAVVTDENSRGIVLKLEEGLLVVSGSAAEVGESRVELIVSYDGPEMAVKLDHRFVSDFLKVLDPEMNVSLEVDGSDAPALFSTDDGYGYVVMPMSRDASKVAASDEAKASV